MTDRELMQQALDALEYASDMTKPENMSGCECPICVTITALRDRLEQPEPVTGNLLKDAYNAMVEKKTRSQKLREAGFTRRPKGWEKEKEKDEQEPVAWVYPEGLQALKAGKPWTAYGTRQEPNNTALYLSPQPNIAPYAWVTFTPYGDEDDVWYENPEGQLLEGWTYKPLYDTTPPQRPWVGLTDEEVSDLWCKVSNTDFVTVDTHEFARAVDDKLRSKNT